VALIDSTALEAVIARINERLEDDFVSFTSRLDDIEEKARDVSDLTDRVDTLENQDGDPNDFDSRIDDLEREMRDKVDESDVPDFSDFETRLEQAEENIFALRNAPVPAVDLTDLGSRLGALEQRADDEKSIESLAERVAALEAASARTTSFFSLLRQAAELVLGR
jgi:predicted  nucleic acid-binding Zn-ribbon protein